MYGWAVTLRALAPTLVEPESDFSLFSSFCGIFCDTVSSAIYEVSSNYRTTGEFKRTVTEAVAT
jgi:hypothetical protein